MIPRWRDLTIGERGAFQVAAAFAEGRLEDRATIAWALDPRRSTRAKKVALAEVVERYLTGGGSEPWASAWRLILAGWAREVIDLQQEQYRVGRELVSGAKSAATVRAIVDLVAPWLQVNYRAQSKGKPKAVGDLIVGRLSSHQVVAPAFFGIPEETDVGFLLTLAHSLFASLQAALFTARKVGWSEERASWIVGEVYRVYFHDRRGDDGHEGDVDLYHEGIAPTVKLLVAVVKRIAELDVPTAAQMVAMWRAEGGVIHLRMWAAMAREQDLVSLEQIGAALLAADDKAFWDVYFNPEMAELRAARFDQVGLAAKEAIVRRLRRGPPKKNWSRKASSAQVDQAREYMAARELKRITVAGGHLPDVDAEWLRDAVNRHPRLERMAHIDYELPGNEEFAFVSVPMEDAFGALVGENLLAELEKSLSAPRVSWGDDKPQSAQRWISDAANVSAVARALAATPDQAHQYPRVIEAFGWAHNATNAVAPDQEAAGIVEVISRLPANTALKAIGGLGWWLYTWRSKVVRHPLAMTLWERLLPVAIKSTNNRDVLAEDEAHPDRVADEDVPKQTGIDDPEKFDSLNSPAARMVDLFFAAFSARDALRPVFADGTLLKAMRDSLVATTGRSGLIVKHRMLQDLAFFLNIDPDWTQDYLIEPLKADNEEARTLWHALGHTTLFERVLSVLGPMVIERSTDPTIGRNTRQRFVFSLVIECLHAGRLERQPVVNTNSVTQVLRSVEDEVRAYAASATVRFLELRKRHGPEKFEEPEALFTKAVQPFLQNIWPQESYLATAGVGRAFAQMPAAARDQFVAAVAAVERFLVPFECWSMVEYGLYGEDNEGKPRLLFINSSAKAEAFLRLLDLTVGRSEGSVVPLDLGTALDQIVSQDAKLEATAAYRRLRSITRQTH
ncbi:MAG: hypothetical protein EOP84_00815 [Verrucomicrobiaceae bacterium]|nr:MAG: hypothetical protein EOP84_00815 [Verrucomicrobiaceae bacterium]